MEEKRFLDEEGFAEYHNQLRKVLGEAVEDCKLYLHTLTFYQTLTTHEGEPNINAQLYVISTDKTPAVYDMNCIIFESSHLIAIYGGYMVGPNPYYLTTENRWYTTANYHHLDGTIHTKTIIERARIPELDFEFNFDEWIWDNVTEI